MKNLLLFKILFFILIVSAFTGCNNEEDVLPAVKDIEVINNGTLLKFKDQATFDNYLSQENINIAGFTSMYDNFNQAMKEAESYYDREGGYEEFKAKYSTLYFPEEGDDYSAYLPVSNENVAKLLNKDGDVMIGDKVVNMKDVNSYQQLKVLGLTPPDESTQSLLRALTCRTSADIYNKAGDRKMWIKADFTPANNQIHIEVSFRKKGAFGIWYNYGSYSYITGTTYVYSTPEVNARYQIGYIPWRNESGSCEASSHDYYSNATSNAQCIDGTIYINHQGFGDINPIAFGLHLTRY